MIYTALASMIAIRPLVVSVANVEVKVGLSTEGVPRPRADLNVTSMAKAFPNPALRLPSFEIAWREEGSSPLSSNRPVAKLVMRLADR